jgi:hypothetical protein
MKKDTTQTSIYLLLIVQALHLYVTAWVRERSILS